MEFRTEDNTLLQHKALKPMTIKMLKQFFCSSSIQSCAILILRTAVTYLKADLLFHEMRFAIKDFKEKEISDSFFFSECS